MKNPIFKAKSVSSGEWVYGNFIHSKRFAGLANEFRIYDQDTGVEHDIDPDTLCMATGMKKYKNQDYIFQNDVFFEEIEYDEGDHRIYYVVTWVDEWARFVLLENFVYIGYIHHGIEALDPDERYDFTKEELSKMHYAGNIINNKELLEA